jgi:hypothetical protein
VEVSYYVEVGGRKVNVPKGSKGCSIEDSSLGQQGEKLGRVEYDPLMFKDPAKMDEGEFFEWLDKAPPDCLENFGGSGDYPHIKGVK